MNNTNWKFCCTSVAQHFYLIKITTTWNALPNEMVNSRTVNSFKTRLDKHWAEIPQMFELTGSDHRSSNLCIFMCLLLDLRLCDILYPEWPHGQGGCLACCGCTFESRWGLHWFTPCKWRSGGSAYEGGGWDQSIGSTVSDAIVRSWLWFLQLGVPHWAASVHYCK